MKAKLYVDVYPGAKPDWLCFSNITVQEPVEKLPGFVRYVFEVELPDSPEIVLPDIIVEKPEE